MTEFVHRNASEALPYLMEAVLKGDEVGSRNGRVKELLFSHVVLTNPLDREIVTPLRKASLPAQIAETVWVLAGRNDVEWLSHYLPRAKDFSDDGETWRGGYGPRLRKWGAWPHQDQLRSGAIGLDQLQFVVDLLRAYPLSRRAVVSLYDPAVDSRPGKDIPCNDWLHFVSRLGALDLHVATRSNDLMWGWSGINAFEWSALLEVVAGLTGLAVGELHFSISSLHLYDRHWNKAHQIAGLVAALPRYPVPSPRFLPGGTVAELDSLLADWFELEQAIREGGLSIDERIEAFPDPMLQSWLKVLAWWWTRDEAYLDGLLGTPLYVAALQSPRGTGDKPEATLTMEAFTNYVSKLHEEKHLAYGDSWKRRGEQIGILANIARKVDRMGKNGGGDDPADTAIDLLCYLVKYRLWLGERVPGAEQSYALSWGPVPSDHSEPVTAMLESLQDVPRYIGANLGLENAIEKDFAVVERMAEEHDPDRVGFVMDLILNAHQLAFRLWVARETWRANNSSRTWKGYDDEA